MQNAGELGIRKPPDELEQDDLAVARVERRQSLAHDQAALRDLGSELVELDRIVGDVVQQRAGPPTPPKLVERGVTRDRKNPRARGAAMDVEQRSASKGALEGERRDR